MPDSPDFNRGMFPSRIISFGSIPTDSKTK